MYNKLSIAILCLALCCACNKTATTYAGRSGLAFASGVLNIEAVEDDGNQLNVPVYRGDFSISQASLSIMFDSTPESSSPTWVETDPEGIFRLTSKKVTFPDNAYSATAHIAFSSFEALGVGRKHRIKLSIEDGTLSPSNRGSVIITASRGLTFYKYGDCEYRDNCIFDNAYETEIYKAREAEIYRVMDPYTKGLVAEEYAEKGWMGATPQYVQFSVNEKGRILFEAFPTGMMFNMKYMAYAYYPSTYKWGKDFSDYDSKNVKVSDKEFQLYAVYCLPDFQFGFLNDGIYPLTIKVL